MSIPGSFTLLRVLLFAVTVALSSAFVGSASAQGCETFRVLVFSKTAGFRHNAQIIAGTSLIQSLGAANGFAVDTTEDATLFTVANLSQYATVIFLNTTGNVLNASQETAFETYVTNGGGFVGIHSATDTEYGWPFYGALVGAYFQNHPAVQNADLTVVDSSHPSTSSLPAVFSHTDEWYNFQTNPTNNPQIQILVTLDETTYSGGTMGAVHPVAWYQDPVGQGRSWYTAFGHTVSTYSAPFFQDHLLGGILFTAGSPRSVTICGGQTYGTGSGTPALALTWNPTSPAFGDVALTAGSPGASGALFVSTCDASIVAPPFTILIDISPAQRLAELPFTFDGAGQFALTLPLSLTLPGTLSTSLYLQAVQVSPTLGLSNGLELMLCP